MMGWVTKVIVSGPGGCIHYELEVIRKALLDAGVTVEVKDECPPDSGIDMNEYLKTQRQRLAEGLSKRNVLLVSDHQPWGG